MVQYYRFGGALTLLLWTAGIAGAQSDDFARLKNFDAQNRTALVSIQNQIQAAAGDPAKLAALESGLISVLEDPAATFAGKQEACRILSRYGTARSVPALTNLLTKSGDDKSADAARYALERIPDSVASKALIAAASQTSGKAQIGIINSLGDRQEAGAVKVLAPLASGSDLITANAATVALGKIGTLDALKALQSLPNPNETVQRATLRCADRLAISGKRDTSEKVYLSLAKSSPYADISESALRGLTAINSKNAGSAALEAAKKSGDPLQLGAASVLAGMADEATTREAIAAYSMMPAPAQVILLNGWSSRGVKAAMPHAESAVSASDATLRITGLNAIAQLGGSKSVPMLAKAAASGTDEEKRTSQQLLANIPGKEASNAIYEAVSSASPEEKTALINVIAERGTDNDRAFLTRAASNSNEALASDAVKALGRIGRPTDYPTIVKTLTTTSSERVRDAAQGAVVEGGQRLKDSQKATDPLIKAMSGSSVATRVSILGALSQLGGDSALTTLTQSLSDSNAEIRAASLTGLSETWTDARPAAALLNVAKTDVSKSNRVQALRGYIRLIGIDERLSAGDKVTQLQTAMKVAERPEEKKQALGVIRECRVPSAVALAGSVLTDPILFDEAADAVLYLAAPQKKGDANLAAVKGPETTTALNQVIKLSKDPEVKQKAEKLK